MTDVLDKIDASLEEVEEQLLDEFDRVRNTVSEHRFASLDPGVQGALREVIDYLYNELQYSGDRETLSLMTDRHEILYSRIAVLRHLINARIPTAHLAEAHDGIEERRQKLEDRVLKQRRQEDPEVSRTTEEKKGGFLSALRGLFDHKPTEQQLERNRIKVTATEEQALERTQIYLDNGIYSASRELAMLASLNRGGTLDTPPDEDLDEGKDTPKPAAGKAIFESRDLSSRAPEAKTPPPREEVAPPISKRDIAQSPDEIRRKLEARRGQTDGGKASFESRELSSGGYREPLRPRAPAPEERKPEPPRSGKALFESRDLSSSSYQEPLRPRRPETEPAKAPEAPRTGKATFASRDIDPVAPSDPPRRRPEPKPVETEKADDQKRSGPAVFESKDLSKAPFPKKD